jgi:hypothetical protein
MTSTRTAKAPMDATRKAALVAGLFYIATFVFSIPALGFYDGVVNDPNFVLGAGSDGGVLWGGLFEVITALAGFGTAVAIYPVLKRFGPARAMGFVASRTLEAAMIFTGVLAVLAVYTLRQDLAGSDAAALTTAASALVAVKKWTFLLGPGVTAGVNALVFASVLYQFRLVPRWIPTLGLIGGPAILLSGTAVLFGAFDQISTTGILATLPVAVWEVSVGVYMIARGLRMPAAVADDALVAPTSPAPVNAVIR